jgi:hypothetical protein
MDLMLDLAEGLCFPRDRRLFRGAGWLCSQRIVIESEGNEVPQECVAYHNYIATLFDTIA